MTVAEETKGRLDAWAEGYIEGAIDELIWLDSNDGKFYMAVTLGSWFGKLFDPPIKKAETK